MNAPESGNYNYFVREREFLWSAERDFYRSYEKALLTLSAAFLAFSLSFLGLLVARKKPVDISALSNLAFLKAAWIAFALSNVFIIVSFITNGLGARCSVERARRIYRGEEAGSCGKWACLGYVLYALAGLLFLLGLVLLIGFCWKNIDKF